MILRKGVFFKACFTEASIEASADPKNPHHTTGQRWVQQGGRSRGGQDQAHPGERYEGVHGLGNFARQASYAR